MSGAWREAEKREASQNRLITKQIELGELKTSFFERCLGGSRKEKGFTKQIGHKTD